jgi:2-oxoglutarate ferredoxin oxidoreductase subunit delta
MSAASAPLDHTGAPVVYTAGASRLTVRRAFCKGCDLCVDACPAGILVLDAEDRVMVTDIARCTFCGLCAGRCPDFVFVLQEAPGTRMGALPFRLDGRDA